MNPEFIPWLWLIFAIILFLVEIFTAGFVLAAFGVGALVAMLVAFLGLGLEWQLAAFVVVSALGVIFSRRFADRISGEQPENFGIDRVIGKSAVVLEPIDNSAATGMVRVEREEWRAQSLDGEPIPVGVTVEVVAVDGTRLLVRPTIVQEA